MLVFTGFQRFFICQNCSVFDPYSAVVGNNFLAAFCTLCRTFGKSGCFYDLLPFCLLGFRLINRYYIAISAYRNYSPFRCVKYVLFFDKQKSRMAFLIPSLRIAIIHHLGAPNRCFSPISRNPGWVSSFHLCVSQLFPIQAHKIGAFLR